VRFTLALVLGWGLSLTCLAFPGNDDEFTPKARECVEAQLLAALSSSQPSQGEDPGNIKFQAQTRLLHILQRRLRGPEALSYLVGSAYTGYQRINDELLKVGNFGLSNQLRTFGADPQEVFEDINTLMGRFGWVGTLYEHKTEGLPGIRLIPFVGRRISGGIVSALSLGYTIPDMVEELRNRLTQEQQRLQQLSEGLSRARTARAAKVRELEQLTKIHQTALDLIKGMLAKQPVGATEEIAYLNELRMLFDKSLEIFAAASALYSQDELLDAALRLAIKDAELRILVQGAPALLQIESGLTRMQIAVGIQGSNLMCHGLKLTAGRINKVVARAITNLTTQRSALDQTVDADGLLEATLLVDDALALRGKNLRHEETERPERIQLLQAITRGNLRRAQQVLTLENTDALPAQGLLVDEHDSQNP